jgi:hypothetical protein
LKALSNNIDFLINTLKIRSENLSNNKIIRFEQIYYNILDEIFINKQIVKKIKSINNDKLPSDFDYKINKNKNKLYIDFFNKLLLSSKNIFNIEEYDGYY